MTSSEDLLALLWKITRGHLEGTYLSQGMVDTGEYIKSFDFFAFDYPHASGSKRYNLEDFSSEADEKSKSQYDSMSIFSWIEVLVTRHSPAKLVRTQYEELEADLLRLVAIWGHTHGFRIKNHIEHFESIQDDYVLNYILAEALEEKYSEYGVDANNSRWLVSKLNNGELNLLVQEDLRKRFQDAGVNSKLLEEDKYAWMQTIKDALGADKNASIMMKKGLINELIDSDGTTFSKSQIIGLHQILITRGSNVLVNIAYAEIKAFSGSDPHGLLEILGCYCGISGGWNFFHASDSGETEIFEEHPAKSNIKAEEISGHITKLEEARNGLIDIDEEGNIVGVSESGQDFISNFHDHTSDDGISFAKTDDAEYDYIEEIQGQWDLDFALG